jgi:hypothetical protein
MLAGVLAKGPWRSDDSGAPRQISHHTPRGDRRGPLGEAWGGHRFQAIRNRVGMVVELEEGTLVSARSRWS